MEDGWKLLRETWTPTDVAPKAVLLANYGNGESLRSVGIRRLAHACKKRGIILEAYDRAGHGESLEKNGKVFGNPKFRGGLIESVATWENHMVHLAALVLGKHKLPLVVLGHSGAGMIECLASDRIVAACAHAGVPPPVFIYAAPGVGAMHANAPCGSMAGYRCCWGCCCCGCCGQPCIPGDLGYINPDGVLGPDTSAKYVNCDQVWIESLPYPKGGADVPEAAAHMTKVQNGLLYVGSKDENLPLAKIKQLAEAVPALTLEIAEGKPHDMLNMNKVHGDTTSVQVIEHFLDWAEAQIGGAP